MQQETGTDGEVGDAEGIGQEAADTAPPTRIAAGIHLVATPIGNARDITLRALDVLRGADILAAEDTRRLRHLMAIHAIALAGRRVLTHHDHNAAASAAELVALAAAGRSVAYASDAGTPLVSDPGFELVRQARAEGVAVHAAPGASALLAALTVAGLPTDRFTFAGFSPAAAGARRSWLQDLARIETTIVLFESPRRIKETFRELCEICPERDMVICRELTKRFEEVMTGTARDLAERLPAEGLRGEVVVLMAPQKRAAASDDELRAALAERLARMSVKDAAAEIAQELGVARRRVYQLAMEMK